MTLINTSLKHLIHSIILLLIVASCAKVSPLQLALEEAGENREELEKVLKRYSTAAYDSLKYKAACFLIENMPGYFYYEGEGLDNYSNYYKWLDDKSKTPQQILDSLNTEYGFFNLSTLKLKYDIQEIDSAYLCENIDLSFKVWQEYPWCKHVTFDEFCEYILPYRIGNEKLTDWRKEYMILYSSSLDSIKTDDPVTTARHLREIILKEKGNPRFTMIKPASYPSLDAFTAESFNGSCDDIAQFTLFLFRAMGIPCTIDYMPLKSDRNVGHSWVSLKNNKGELFLTDFFKNIEYLTEHSANRTYPKVKVYSKTFSKNTNAINNMLKVTDSVPFEFDDNNYRFIDVTYLYTNHLTNTEIPIDLLYPDKRKKELIYLCMPSWLNWIPVDWSIKENDKFVFNIESGSIVRLAAFEKGKLNFICDPFVVQRQSRKILSYSSQKEIKSITLFSKFSLDRELLFRNRMVGGVFEGSNNPQFKNADTLYVIKKAPYRLFTQIPVSSNKEYRYVRFKGPLKSHCNVAEVQFFSDTTYLTGKIIGTPGAWRNSESHEYTNVFDGSTDTSFDHNTPSEGWSGLDLNTPTKITKIVYTPRNYANYIKEGQQYELFYSDKNGWESLGIQTPKSDSLYYDNAPVGTLYYLKNYSEGNQERIFYIEDNEPVFK